MEDKISFYYNSLFERYPQLQSLKKEVWDAFVMLKECYEHGGKLIVAGNGGSCADAEHFVGELMKGFKLKRECTDQFKEALIEVNSEDGEKLAENLELGLPAIALSSHPSLNTAYMNDRNPEYMYAQQLSVLGKAGDIFVAISTSGNSKNIYAASIVAKAMGIKVLSLTGKTGGKLGDISNLSLVMPGDETYMIQELHLPVYHTLCLMLEEFFFD